jgi:hypothetical protein
MSPGSLLQGHVAVQTAMPPPRTTTTAATARSRFLDEPDVRAPARSLFMRDLRDLKIDARAQPARDPSA